MFKIKIIFIPIVFLLVCLSSIAEDFTIPIMSKNINEPLHVEVVQGEYDVIINETIISDEIKEQKINYDLPSLGEDFDVREVVLESGKYFLNIKEGKEFYNYNGVIQKIGKNNQIEWEYTYIFYLAKPNRTCDNFSLYLTERSDNTLLAFFYISFCGKSDETARMALVTLDMKGNKINEIVYSDNIGSIIYIAEINEIIYIISKPWEDKVNILMTFDKDSTLINTQHFPGAENTIMLDQNNIIDIVQTNLNVRRDEGIFFTNYDINGRLRWKLLFLHEGQLEAKDVELIGNDKWKAVFNLRRRGYKEIKSFSVIFTVKPGDSEIKSILTSFSKQLQFNNEIHYLYKGDEYFEGIIQPTFTNIPGNIILMPDGGFSYIWHKNEIGYQDKYSGAYLRRVDRLFNPIWEIEIDSESAWFVPWFQRDCFIVVKKKNQIVSIDFNGKVKKSISLWKIVDVTGKGFYIMEIDPINKDQIQFIAKISDQGIWENDIVAGRLTNSFNLIWFKRTGDKDKKVEEYPEFIFFDEKDKTTNILYLQKRDQKRSLRFVKISYNGSIIKDEQVIDLIPDYKNSFYRKKNGDIVFAVVSEKETIKVFIISSQGVLKSEKDIDIHATNHLTAPVEMDNGDLVYASDCMGLNGMALFRIDDNANIIYCRRYRGIPYQLVRTKSGILIFGITDDYYTNAQDLIQTDGRNGDSLYFIHCNNQGLLK